MSASWQRFRTALTGARHPEIAAGPLVAADHAAFVSGLPLPQVIQSDELLCKSLIKTHQLYQGDFLILFADVYVEAEAMGCRLAFPEDAPPHVIQTCPPEALKAAAPQRDGRLPMMIKAAERIAAELGSEIPVFASIKDPFSAAALACGADDFLPLLISQPGRARLAIDRALLNQQSYIEALLKTGVHIIIGAPMASGGILGARHFHCFALQPILELVNLIRSAGRLAGIHICGDSDPILEQLAHIPAHFLSLESFSIARWKELASDGQPHPAVMGYFPTALLLTGNKQTIEAEASKELRALWGFPHILATSCDVPQRCPAEKVQAFMRAARKYHPA